MNINIIGGGMAGLSCAIHLQNSGHQVQIFEKNSKVGGRANRIEKNGFKIDMGPTLVIMPEVLEGVFRLTGRNMADYIKLVKVEPGYRINFEDDKFFDMTTDKKKFEEQIAKFAPKRIPHFKRYLKDVENKFEYSRDAFIERNFDSLMDMFDLGSLQSALKIKPWGRAFQHVYSYFKNDYLATALSCQALYLGQTPLKTPALYNLLAYLEFTYGIWFPMGGLHEIPKALAKLFGDMGGVIHLDSEVESIVIEGDEVKGLRLKNGSIELSDVVVSNRDLPASFYNFVGEDKRPSVSNAKIDNWNYGCSCFMTYLGVNKKVPGLFHHNLFVNKDIRVGSRQIFDEGRLSDDPLLYVCSPTKTDPSLAPEGKEVVYILAIVPNLSAKPKWPDDAKPYRKKIFARLKQNGIDIQDSDIELEETFTPNDFESVYGSHLGTAFGLAPDFFQSAAFRPTIKSKDLKGLYHVGASTHPGGGLPMVLTCGRLAAEVIEKDADKARSKTTV